MAEHTNPLSGQPRPNFGIWLADPDGRPQMFADAAGVINWVATDYDDDAIDALLDGINEQSTGEQNHSFILAKLRNTPPPYHIFPMQEAGEMTVNVISFAPTRDFID